MTHALVKPVRLRERSKTLTVDTSRIVAYRATCADGWRGSSRKTYRAAALDARAHNAEAHRIVAAHKGDRA